VAAFGTGHIDDYGSLQMKAALGLNQQKLHDFSIAKLPSIQCLMVFLIPFFKKL
jgi:hypothetical protein